MAKAKISCQMESYGLYSAWDRASKTLPEVREFTRTIPARLGVEFGYILKILKGKGKQLHFCIDHPPFLDESGQVAPPFTGVVYIRSNDWQFFLGDTLWEPIEDKCGSWHLTVEIEGEIVADKTFTIVMEEE